MHRKHDHDARRHRVQDGANAEDGARAGPVDLPPGDRRPDPDGNRVDRHDQARSPVAPALSAHEEKQRERRHPERQPAEQRPPTRAGTCGSPRSARSWLVPVIASDPFLELHVLETLLLGEEAREP